jgi:UDP-N-acetylmuramoylalanine--D-glutamate ligase
MDVDFLKDKNTLIMGLGKFGGGLDAALFAARCGAKVTVTDLAQYEKLKDSLDLLKDFQNIKYHLAGHREEDFGPDGAEIIIVNPAVPEDNKYLKIARQARKKITSQIEIFFQLCPAKIIGITGANGKSTTTALTHHLLNSLPRPERKHYENVCLSGNIGKKPLLTLLPELKQNDIVVLEISSFQIDQLTRINTGPEIALITNITPNHLDRHGTFENYCRSKKMLFEMQNTAGPEPAVSIFNALDPVSGPWYDEYKKQPNRICIRYSPEDIPERIDALFKLPGQANKQNLAAAIAAAKQLGLTEQQIEKSLNSFTGLPDRLEFVDEKKGVTWYNDSISTTPTSTIAAIEAFDQPIILIAGGYDKKLPFEQMAKTAAEKIKAAVLIGQTAKKIEQAIKNHLAGKNMQIENATSMDDAVKTANSLASPGDVVVLSPACASYDMFTNYAHRAQEFKTSVKKLNKK